MIRAFAVLGVGCAMSVAAFAVPVCPVTSGPAGTTDWIFNTIAQCGSDSNGVSFTQNGETITIFPEKVNGATGAVSSPNNGLVLNGLFEVGKGQQGNIASGIGPYINGSYGESGSPYVTQKGIQDLGFIDYTLLIEVSQTGPGAISSGSVLNFLMQEGATEDSFNVFTGTSSTNTVPGNIYSSLTELCSSVGVNQTCNPPGPNTDNGTAHSVLSGKATVPQFSVTTSTSAADPYEFIAIQADCDYLLLNAITSNTSTVPEPRFYGLLLAGLLGFAGLVYRKRRAARV